MYSGLLPRGLSEGELSSDEEEEQTDEEEEPNAQSDTETEKPQAESDQNVPNDRTPSAPSSAPKSPSDPSSPSAPKSPSDPSSPSAPKSPSDPSSPSAPKSPSDPSSPSAPKSPSNPSSPSAPKSPSDPPSPPESCWPGVSQELCRKFKDLQKKRESQKRDKTPGRKRGKKRHRKGGTCKQTSGDAEEKKDDEEVRLKKLQELTQYFGTNDRFQPAVCSRPSPKSGLEKNMERAIAEGDYGKAEELSDRLATRELAVKLAQAVDCRDFARARREEEDSRAAERKRKQIAWGFEAKKRWETKSNMGYM